MALEHLAKAEEYARWAGDWYQTGGEHDEMNVARTAAAIGQLHLDLALARVELGEVDGAVTSYVNGIEATS